MTKKPFTYRRKSSEPELDCHRWRKEDPTGEQSAQFDSNWIRWNYYLPAGVVQMHITSGYTSKRFIFIKTRDRNKVISCCV
jgi:hypothetical protein